MRSKAIKDLVSFVVKQRSTEPGMQRPNEWMCNNSERGHFWCKIMLVPRKKTLINICWVGNETFNTHVLVTSHP